MRATTARPAFTVGNPPPRRDPAVAVIGAGFSGTLLALHLLRRCPPAVRIQLVEQSRRCGRGLAYSTGNLNHVLNVPTARMSASHDRPNDFLDWLRQSGEPCAATVTANCFVARKTFGDYVRHHLKEELRRTAGDGRRRLVLTRGRALDLQVERGGVVLEIDRGRRIGADIAVLAVGNFPPEAPPIADPAFYDSDRYCVDPWAPEALSGLDPAEPVLLIGTGLTMVDTAIALFDRGHTGTIHALSRRGLLRRRHAATPLSPHPMIDRALPSTLLLAARLRRHRRVPADVAAGGAVLGRRSVGHPVCHQGGRCRNARVRDGSLLDNMAVSLRRSGIAFGAAVGFAIPLGLFMGSFRRFEEIVDPLLQLFRQTSALAIYPIFILLLGLGEISKVAIIFWAAFFPILLNTISGVKQVDRRLIEMARVFGASRGAVFRRVVLPGATPAIFVGLRLSATTAPLLLVAAGYLADQVVVMASGRGGIGKVVAVKLPRPRDRSSVAFVKLREDLLREFHLCAH